MSASICPYSRNSSFTVDAISHDAFNTAIATGDWLAAAMSLVEIDSQHVRFNGKSFRYSTDALGCLHRLETTIKEAALDFGLHEGQTERFYGRVSKRIGRFLASKPRALKNENHVE